MKAADIEAIARQAPREKPDPRIGQDLDRCGVSLELATTVFEDPFAVERLDSNHSARRATQHEQDDYFRQNS